MREAPNPSQTLSLVSNLGEAIEQKNIRFNEFKLNLEDSLHSQINRINNSIISTESSIQQKETRVRLLQLQVGDVQHVVFAKNFTKEVWYGANTIVECAFAQDMNSKRIGQAEQIFRVVNATNEFVTILANVSNQEVAQSSCFSQVDSVLQTIANIGQTIITDASEAFAVTKQLCLASQKRIMSDSGWMNSNEIPLLEVLVAMKNEIQLLSDVIEELKIDLSNLTKEREIKQLRLINLQQESIEHNFDVALQKETIVRMSKLISGFKTH